MYVCIKLELFIYQSIINTHTKLEKIWIKKYNIKQIKCEISFSKRTVTNRDPFLILNTEPNYQITYRFNTFVKAWSNKMHVGKGTKGLEYF